MEPSNQQDAASTTNNSEGSFQSFTHALTDRLIPIYRSIVRRSPRVVWYELRDSGGKPFRRSSASEISCPYGSDIADVC